MNEKLSDVKVGDYVTLENDEILQVVGQNPYNTRVKVPTSVVIDEMLNGKEKEHRIGVFALARETPVKLIESPVTQEKHKPSSRRRMSSSSWPNWWDENGSTVPSVNTGSSVDSKDNSSKESDDQGSSSSKGDGTRDYYGREIDWRNF